MPLDLDHLLVPSRPWERRRRPWLLRRRRQGWSPTGLLAAGLAACLAAALVAILTRSVG